MSLEVVVNRYRALLGVVAVLTFGPFWVEAQVNNDTGMPWEAARTAIVKEFEGR